MSPLSEPGDLADDVVRLRLIDDRDVAVVEVAARDPAIREAFRLWKLTPVEYVDRYTKAWREGRAAAFAVSESGADETAGHVIVELGSTGRADVGYWLLAEARGRGLATRALRLVAGWALSLPQVARLQLWTVPDNVPSQRVAERAGFTREGVLRSYGVAAGRRVDAVSYSLLPEDLGLSSDG